MLEVLVLAIVQGLTEFLPVSSSGHLLLVGELLGFQITGIELNIALHVGTLVSILIFYRERLLRLLRDERERLGVLVVASVPAAAAGFLLKSQAPDLLESPLLAGAMLIFTGVVLLSSRFLTPRDGSIAELSYGRALAVGLFQAVALFPGVSRSGMTIVGGLLFGLGRTSSVTFSFLLAIPAIAGAAALELLNWWREPAAALDASPWALLVGLVVACAVGLLGLRWLVGWVQRGGLHWFAAWCLPAGVAVLLIFASR